MSHAKLLYFPGAWCSGLTCGPVKAEIAGSNPVAPAGMISTMNHKFPLCDSVEFFLMVSLGDKK